MKKLTKIKLNQLSSAELNEREMCQLLGGSIQCGCNYAYSGGSSSSANSSANNPTTQPPQNVCDCFPQPTIPPTPQSSLCPGQHSCWF